MKKTILVVLAVLLSIVLILLPRFYKTNLVNINNQDSIINNILERKGYDSIEVVKAKKYYDYYAVIYNPNPKLDNSKENLELMIYKKTQSFSSNNYEYYGGASSTRNFNTFNINEEGNKTTIIVYGDNRSKNAYSYSITNSEITYKKNIKGDLILDIYIILDSDNCSSVNELYDINGKVIEIF
ncbi:MAG: hypothetical protein RR630_01750 [Coprobacillus sp.]